MVVMLFKCDRTFWTASEKGPQSMMMMSSVKQAGK